MKLYPPNAQGEMRPSSTLTPVLKFVAPWLIFVIGSTVIIAGTMAGLRVFWLMGPVVVIFAVLYARVSVGLKSVIATNDGLRGSNHRTTILIPYDWVTRVEVPHAGWPSQIWLRKFTDFGSCIRYLPGPQRPFAYTHPANELIRERAGLSGQERGPLHPTRTA